jgi:hypothetical protein
LLLLVSGASGVGKSTARIKATALLGGIVEAIELWHFGPLPAVPTIEWRQQLTEQAVQRAIGLETLGRHVLFAGDPIAAGEVLAAPSADQIDIAVCLLDANEEAQTARLQGRDGTLDLLPNNLGYAEWMRRHATDPSHMPFVLVDNGWSEMKWERWTQLDASDPRWEMTVIDTSAQTPDETASALADWCRDAIAGRAPVFKRGWSQA